MGGDLGWVPRVAIVEEVYRKIWSFSLQASALRCIIAGGSLGAPGPRVYVCCFQRVPSVFGTVLWWPSAVGTSPGPHGDRRRENPRFVWFYYVEAVGTRAKKGASHFFMDFLEDCSV